MNLILVMFGLAPIQTWGIGDFLIAIVVIAAAVGITYIALRVFGVTIPGWLVQIFWICIAAVVAIFAIRFVLSL